MAPAPLSSPRAGASRAALSAANRVETVRCCRTDAQGAECLRAVNLLKMRGLGEMTRNTFLWIQTSTVLLALLLSAGVSAAAGASNPKEAKVSAYIELINQESNHLLQNYDGYSQRVKDLRAGPTCKETGGAQSWLSSMGPSAPERVAKYRKLLAKQPKLEADAAALEMVDALDSLYKPVSEASDYYFLSKFKQDDCKRGHELHPLLMAGWTKYMKAERVVRAFLDKYTDERDAADLKDLQKKYGKLLHYYQRKLMVDAKALIRVSDVAQLDPAVVRSALATFGTSLAEARVVVEKEKKGKNADALYQGGYEQLLTHAGWLKDAVDEVLRVVDNEAKDPKSAARTNSRPTAMQNLLTAYNGLVDQSNQTMYSKSMK